MVRLTRKENSTNAKKTSILRLLSVPARYIKRKIKTIYEKISKKRAKKNR